MWNDFDTASYGGMIAETVSLKGYNGDTINAYYSRPLNVQNCPTLVLIPHMPGWDEYCREAARRFTEHNYAVICPNIYARFGSGKPADVARKAREEGGAKDKTVMGDVQASIDFVKSQPISNGKTGVIGMCSGGRHTFLAACTLDGIDAAADLWGGGVIQKEEELSPARPKAPFDFAENLSCPLIGIFGNDDRHPGPEEVNILEEKLKELGKEYEFYRYDGAGHGIWYYDKPMYRQEAAMDSQEKVFAFFEKYLR